MFGRTYCRLTQTGVDVLALLVKVTITDTMDCGLPCTVNGWVMLPLRSRRADAALEYHRVKRSLMGTIHELRSRLASRGALAISLPDYRHAITG